MQSGSQTSTSFPQDYFLSQYQGARDNQEDFATFKVLSGDEGLLSVLCDGMGGHTSGEVASRSAVNQFVKTYESLNNGDVFSKLKQSLDEANRYLKELIIERQDLKGMGCTLVAAYIAKSQLYWISVGDSLLFIFRDNKLLRLNEDHSMYGLIQESLKLGKITEQEAAGFINKNALRSALTGDEIPLVDKPVSAFELRDSDLIILASDGLLTLANQEIETVISDARKGDCKTIVNSLLSRIKRKKSPSQDNTTIQAIKIHTNQKSLNFSRWKKLVFIIFFSMLGASLVIYIGIKLGVQNA